LPRDEPGGVGCKRSRRGNGTKGWQVDWERFGMNNQSTVSSKTKAKKGRIKRPDGPWCKGWLFKSTDSENTPFEQELKIERKGKGTEERD